MTGVRTFQEGDDITSGIYVTINACCREGGFIVTGPAGQPDLRRTRLLQRSGETGGPVSVMIVRRA
jgi:hypothetical protein